MANKKLSLKEVALIIFLLVLCGLILGCSSAPKTVAPNVYYCPSGHEIPMKNINKDIRAINTCPVCGAEFPYLEEKKNGGYCPWSRVWVYRYGTTRFHSYRDGH